MPVLQKVLFGALLCAGVVVGIYWSTREGGSSRVSSESAMSDKGIQTESSASTSESSEGGGAAVASPTSIPSGNGEAAAASGRQEKTDVAEIHIYVASHKGSTMKHALRAQHVLEHALGVTVTVRDLATVSAASLCEIAQSWSRPPAQLQLFMTSTFTRGTPPTAAEALFALLSSVQPGELGCFRYAVAAPGASPNHPATFAKAGRDLDAKLAAIGGRRVVPVHTIDAAVDPAGDRDNWLRSLVNALLDPSLPRRALPLEEPLSQTTPSPAMARRASGSTTRPNSVVILFGTQSGNSEGIAMELRRHLQREHGIHEVTVADIEYYKSHPPRPDCFFIFVIATYGDGEPSESAIHFWREMKSKALNDSGVWLGVPACVVGLGNAAYQNYCGFAVKLTRKLKTLKAYRVCSPVKLNDAEDLDGQLETWLRDNFDPAVRELYARPKHSSSSLSCSGPVGVAGAGGCSANTPPHTIVEAFQLIPPTSAIEFSETVPGSTVVKPLFSASTDQFTITRVTVLGDVEWPTRRLFRVEISSTKELDPRIFYAGSTFSMYPSMDEKETIRLLDIFEYQGTSLAGLADHRLNFLVPTSTVPSGTTLRQLVGSLSNFNVTPTFKWLLSALLPALPSHHPVVDMFNGVDAEETYRSAIKQPPLTLREVLYYFHDKQPFRLPLTFLLECITRLAPRQYTVASAVFNRTFHLLVGESFKERSYHPRIDGMVSSTLARYHLNTIEGTSMQSPLSIPIRAIAANAIFQPDTWKRGGVWVVNGSGVSAVMAFLDQRLKIALNGNGGAPVVMPETYLVYGARSSNICDFAGEAIIREAVTHGVLTGAFFAFSRNPSHKRCASMSGDGRLIFTPAPDEEKVYVNTLVTEQSQIVRKAMLTKHEDPSVVVLCGSNNMKGMVWGALVKTFEPEGIEFLSNLIAQGRVLAECW